MIIRTAQQQMAANCCGCDAPLAPEPRVECESVATRVFLCGFSGNNTSLTWALAGLPCEAKFAVFRTLTTYKLITRTGYTSYDRTQVFARQPNPTSLICETTTVSDDYDPEEVIPPAGGGLTIVSRTQGWVGGDYVIEEILERAAVGYVETTRQTFSGFAANTFARLIGEAQEQIAKAFADDEYSHAYLSRGASCVASSAINQETLCGDPAVVDGVGALYRLGVPEDYSTGPAPRSVYEAQWDEVFASHAWWAWYDGGMIGAEPSPGPVLVASRSWTWGGSMATEGDQFSDWFELGIPAAPGQVRRVNLLVISYHSARLGTKPTAYGPQVVIPEP